MMCVQRFCFSVCSLTVMMLSAGSAQAAPLEYSLGHADIGLAYEGGELELHYHFGSGAVLDGTPSLVDLELQPEAAYVRVPDSAVRMPGVVPFLGTSVTDPVWVLPPSNTSGLPFLGIAAEDLESSEIASATISLTDFRGPGQFALWQGVFSPTVFWQTNDGLSSTDLLNVAIGGHDHYSYGFTAEGVYDLEFFAQANLDGGGSVTDVGVFRFVVGNSTVVPEPTGFAVLVAAGFGVIGCRRRRIACL